MFAVQGVCKTYQGHQVLSPVSFVLPEGQCLGVAGSNGSGKSTLLRILAQIQPPDKGDIPFDGESVMGDRRFLRTQLGYVPQNNELIPELTVLQQLRLWCIEHPQKNQREYLLRRAQRLVEQIDHDAAAPNAAGKGR